MMDWSPWVLDIPIDVAQTKGFYERRGLTVHQTLPVGATDVVKFVSTGKSQFGLYYAPDMLMALEAGAPLVSIGSLMSHAPVGMAFRPGLTGDSPAVLAGQTVSVPLIPSTRASFASMLAKAGVDPKTVNIVDPGFELVAPLLKGTVAAAAFTEFGELVAAEAQGQKLTYLDFRDWGTPDFAFLNIITTQEFAKANPNTTRAFVQATLEGLAYAAAHPEEAVALYVKAHPELDRDAAAGAVEGGHPLPGPDRRRPRRLAGPSGLGKPEHMDEERGSAQRGRRISYRRSRTTTSRRASSDEGRRPTPALDRAQPRRPRTPASAQAPTSWPRTSPWAMTDARRWSSTSICRSRRASGWPSSAPAGAARPPCSTAWPACCGLGAAT